MKRVVVERGNNGGYMWRSGVEGQCGRARAGISGRDVRSKGGAWSKKLVDAMWEGVGWRVAEVWGWSRVMGVELGVWVASGGMRERRLKGGGRRGVRVG